MTVSKRKAAVQEGVNYLNALFGYSDPIPDAPATRVHRINDKPINKSGQYGLFQDYKKVIMDFIVRNPRCGAKQISVALAIPHPTVQSILTKASTNKEVERIALHDQRGCRPIYIYWIKE